jgi:hypothetical protein
MKPYGGQRLCEKPALTTPFAWVLRQERARIDLRKMIAEIRAAIAESEQVSR